VHKVLEARVGAERIEARPQQDAWAKSLRSLCRANSWLHPYLQEMHRPWQSPKYSNNQGLSASSDCSAALRLRSLPWWTTDTGEFIEKTILHEGNAVREVYAGLSGYDPQ
jgi:hypothetical protein